MSRLDHEKINRAKRGAQVHREAEFEQRRQTALAARAIWRETRPDLQRSTNQMNAFKEHADALRSLLPSIDPSIVASERPNLTVRVPSPHQVQVMQDGKVFADWWPSKGTTMADGKHGPKCRNAAQVVEWLRDL